MKHTLLSFGVVSLAFAGGLLAGATLVGSARAAGGGTYAALDTLARAMTTIEREYVEPVESGALVRAAVVGMAESLDPHSVYLDADAWRGLQDRNEGRWFGVGVEIRPDPAGARIGRVVTGGPAALAGVQAGDVLVAVDGQDLAGLSLREVGDKLEGERGAPVVLTLLRGEQRQDRTVVRDQVLAPVVDAALLAPGQGYARVEHFRQRTAAELAQALTRLEDEGGQPLRGLVLDLRDNPGGLLEEAVAVVDLFAGEGMVVETRGRDGQVVERHSAKRSPGDRDLVLVVLVNGMSASASEIVAGALQELGRATVVGTPSFGKGSVQQVYEFEDGSALKLTVARYHLASGRSFTVGDGVQPDQVVPLHEAPAAALARLEQALAQLPSDQAAALKADLAQVATAGPEVHDAEVPWDGSLAERLAIDPQLRAAWDRVHAAR